MTVTNTAKAIQWGIWIVPPGAETAAWARMCKAGWPTVKVKERDREQRPRDVAGNGSNSGP